MTDGWGGGGVVSIAMRKGNTHGFFLGGGAGALALACTTRKPLAGAVSTYVRIQSSFDSCLRLRACCCHSQEAHRFIF